MSLKNTVFLMSIHRISENIYCVMLLSILHTTLEKVQKPGIPDPSVPPLPDAADSLSPSPLSAALLGQSRCSIPA